MYCDNIKALDNSIPYFITGPEKQGFQSKITFLVWDVASHGKLSNRAGE